MNTIGLFPKPFVTDNIKQHPVMHEIKQLLKLAENDADFLENPGNGNFLHKDTYLLRTLPDLSALLTTRTNEFLFDIMGEHRTKLVITQSWLNINPPGSHHKTHRHKNSIISGVLYLQCDQNTGNFNAHRDHSMFRDVSGDVDQHNPFTYEYVTFSPTEFDLYLFQSNLKHSVDTNKSSITRLSLSFNTFYSGVIDDGEYLSGLTVN